MWIFGFHLFFSLSSLHLCSFSAEEGKKRQQQPLITSCVKFWVPFLQRFVNSSFVFFCYLAEGKKSKLCLLSNSNITRRKKKKELESRASLNNQSVGFCCNGRRRFAAAPSLLPCSIALLNLTINIILLLRTSFSSSSRHLCLTTTTTTTTTVSWPRFWVLTELVSLVGFCCVLRVVDLEEKEEGRI